MKLWNMCSQFSRYLVRTLGNYAQDKGIVSCDKE